MASGTSSGSIIRLPPEVVAQIKSAAAITSLNTVVLELVKNSLDASASRINVFVEYSKGSCTVEDNGLGVPPDEFKENGGLDSSKTGSSRSQYGNRGAFLASTAALSLMTISSKHHQHYSTSTVIFSQSRVVARRLNSIMQTPLSSDHGTRVTIRDLFGNMPVRVKQRVIQSAESQGNKKDWDELRKNIAGHLLAWGKDVTVSVKTDSTQKFLINAKEQGRSALTDLLPVRVSKTLYQSGLIKSPDSSPWTSVSASTNGLSIRGTISLDPVSTKTVQFISFGIHSIANAGGHNLLFEEINKCFANSAFGIEEFPNNSIGDDKNMPREGDRRHIGNVYSRRELKGPSKSVDRWPMLYFDIESKTFGDTNWTLDNGALAGEQDNNLVSIIALLQAVCVQFLRTYNFRPKHDKKKAMSSNIRPLLSRTTQHISVSDGRPVSLTTSAAQDMARDLWADHFGTGIKLPSFRQSCAGRPESPFFEWSRVKIGDVRLDATTKGKENPVRSSLKRSHLTPIRFQALTHALDTDGLSAIKSGHLLEAPEHVARLSSSPSISSISRSGRLNRAPFASPPTKRINQTASGKLKENELCSKLQDNAVLWIHPDTQERSMVDTRTGFSMSEHQVNKTRSNGHEAIEGEEDFSLTRNVGSRPRTPLHDGSAAWIRGLFEEWQNPVFSLTELPVPCLAHGNSEIEAQTHLHGHRHNCTQLGIKRAFESSAGMHGKISKKALQESEMVAQVDRKFILLKVDTSESTIMVIVDQHAADERCRIERLLQELCSPPFGSDHAMFVGVHTGIQTARLERSIIFDIPQREILLFQNHAQRFMDWGIVYEVIRARNTSGDSNEQQHLAVSHLPPTIIERCKLDCQLLVDFLRTEVSRCEEHCQSRRKLPIPAENQSWLLKIHDCPKGIIEMLNSRACRSSIMFNDELSNEQCLDLIARLADCSFPFQCAHGRPSMIPLVDLGTMTPPQVHDGESDDFIASYASWRKKEA